jgi:hypothetical protein
MFRTLICGVAFVGTGLCAGTAMAQGSTSYSNYYQRQLQDYNRPSVNPRTYTYDRVFYNNPAISPYSNLVRPTGPYANNYYQYTLPEQQRRQQATVRAETTLPGKGGYGGGGPSGYYNHHFGHWGGQALAP